MDIGAEWRGLRVVVEAEVVASLNSPGSVYGPASDAS